MPEPLMAVSIDAHGRWCLEFAANQDVVKIVCGCIAQPLLAWRMERGFSTDRVSARVAAVAIDWPHVPPHAAALVAGASLELVGRVWIVRVHFARGGKRVARASHFRLNAAMKEEEWDRCYVLVQRPLLAISEE